MEIKIVCKSAFHAYFSFTDVLQALGVTGHKNDKLMIQIEAESQHYRCGTRHVLLNRIDVFQKIHVYLAEVLLAQKCLCVLKRKRLLGRDLYDVSYLSGLVSPDFGYLKKKADIPDSASLKRALIERCRSADFKALARDVAPFLFQHVDEKRVLLFLDSLS